MLKPWSRHRLSGTDVEVRRETAYLTRDAYPEYGLSTWLLLKPQLPVAGDRGHGDLAALRVNPFPCRTVPPAPQITVTSDHAVRVRLIDFIPGFDTTSLESGRVIGDAVMGVTVRRRDGRRTKSSSLLSKTHPWPTRVREFLIVRRAAGTRAATGFCGVTGEGGSTTHPAILGGIDTTTGPSPPVTRGAGSGLLAALQARSGLGASIAADRAGRP